MVSNFSDFGTGVWYRHFYHNFFFIDIIDDSSKRYSTNERNSPDYNFNEVREVIFQRSIRCGTGSSQNHPSRSKSTKLS
jgi:hypothetical protein